MDEHAFQLDGAASLIAGEKKNAYFAAVQVGLGKDYGPMESLFAEIIEQSLGSS